MIIKREQIYFELNVSKCSFCSDIHAFLVLVCATIIKTSQVVQNLIATHFRNMLSVIIK